MLPRHVYITKKIVTMMIYIVPKVMSHTDIVIVGAMEALALEQIKMIIRSV